MTGHQILFVLMCVAALGADGTACAQTATSQGPTPEALQRVLQAPAGSIDVTRKIEGALACPTCMPGAYGPLGTKETIPQIRPGQFDKFVDHEKKSTRPWDPPLIACAPVHLKVGASKIGVINASDKTHTFAIKLGTTDQIVKLAPGEIETVTLLVGATALAGTSDNSIPTQTLTGGTVYRLQAQDGKWAFVAD